MNKKKLLPYIVIPTVYVVFIFGLYLIAGRNMWAAFISDMKIAAMKGAPKYSYVNMQPENEKKPKEEKVEGEGKVKSPLYGSKFGEIECEEAEFMAPVYYGDSVEILKKGIGVFAGSKIPGENGIILVGGKYDTFMGPIRNLKKGNRITFTTTYGEYLYEVNNIKVADISENQAFNLPGEKEELILYTSYPSRTIRKGQTKRYYVHAKKITDVRSQGGK